MRTEIQLNHLRMSALHASIVLCLCGSSRSYASCLGICSQLGVVGEKFRDENNGTKVSSAC